MEKISQVKVGEINEIQGFVQNIRNKRTMAFLVLRDATGEMQLTIEKEKSEEMAALVDQLTLESVITVKGMVVENSYVKDFSNTHNSKARYDYIVSGFLRREIGEEVGTYRICNYKSIGTEHASCNISIKGINEARTHTLVPGVNVYYVKEDLTYALTTGTTIIRYGMYFLLDGEYYKLTRDNTDLTNSKFTDVLTRNVWAYHYDTDVDTQDFTLSIEANLNNGNQNYYLVYVDSL